MVMPSLAGESLKTLRVQLLKEQRAVQCDDALAKDLENKAEVLELGKGVQFIKQGNHDDDVFFILRGSAIVETNGHKHVTRKPGCHVGEMALLDPGSGRSANVVAGDNGVVVLKVSGANMRELGTKHPALWRNIARELTERLRGRDSLFIQPNEIPAIFIASSGAARKDLKRVERGLASKERAVRPWNGPDIFMPSDYTLDNLLEQAHCVDFAVIIATPDDLIVKNAASTPSPTQVPTARDNVLLEFGLFAGALERKRVVVLQKENVGLPTDMQGLTVLRYKNKDELDKAIKQIADRVDQLGPMQRLTRRENC
jgi:CRP/FNR family transcriptional regulator, cyclic AMP receptor protein